MSAITIAGDTSGSITLDAPAVAGSTTLTLPATNGTFILANASGNLQANSGYGSVATGYLCRAWVTFNGTGTVAISASGNVTSITDNGVGDYTVNITTAMPDVNYSIAANAAAVGSVNFQCPIKVVTSVSAFSIYTSNGTATTDSTVICVQVFR
jgi:hypothetical protein